MVIPALLILQNEKVSWGFLEVPLNFFLHNSQFVLDVNLNILFYFIIAWDSQFALIDIAGISKVQITE